MQATSMEVNGPDMDVLESPTCAELWARELGKIDALIPNLCPNALFLESIGKLSHNNAPQEFQCHDNAHHLTESLI